MVTKLLGQSLTRKVQLHCTLLQTQNYYGVSNFVWSVAFSFNGRFALSGSFDKTLKLVGRTLIATQINTNKTLGFICVKKNFSWYNCIAPYIKKKGLINMNIEMLKIDSSYQISIPILETYQDKYVRKFLDYLRIKEITILIIYKFLNLLIITLKWLKW